jgi:hypothetical protein
MAIGKDNVKVLESYPNMQTFKYNSSSNSLVSIYGNISLDNMDLTSIDPVFFKMDSYDIYLYLSDKFYQKSNKLEYINGLFETIPISFGFGETQNTIINDTDKSYLIEFAKFFCDRCHIYLNNKDYLDSLTDNENVKGFIYEFLECHKIIDESKEKASINGNDAASILYNSYESYLNNLSVSSNFDNSKSMEKGISLTRIKPNGPKYSEEDNYDNTFDIAGFASILLILITIISFGIYLGLHFIG